ncbi:MAG: 2Fe-2S iron-sulfur cluster-binding protein [Phycisphaerales bacterium]
MPKITINGRESEFQPGQVILQVANANEQPIPQYCYHDGLSIVASCRICLAEIWMPNKQTGKLEPYMGGKLMPTCQTACMDGMVVYTDSPKSMANQKAVMEYLLINHPLDCPVCDQAGECFLQDYSYEYGRGQSRFEEVKVKQPKKDLGPHIYLYADRCIMCTRCVRFTREVTGTGELLVAGRGNREEIDVFPGHPIDNELASNVVDLCPVGALLDKDFLFAQRVWFLKSTPSIDGITASGDNISIEHNDGKIYRIKPRTNMAINRWWITDEVRYGWKFVHRADRLGTPARKQFGVTTECDWTRACTDAVDGLKKAVAGGKRLGLMVSPMLSCEDAFTLAQAALAIDDRAFLGVGPIPVHGPDKLFPAGAKDGDPKAFKMYAEKAPNARGVRRVLEALSKKTTHSGYVPDAAKLTAQIRNGEIGGVIVCGNYPSDWATPELREALKGKFVVLIDTLPSILSESADIVLPGATWAEKAGTFQNARNMLQAFEAAIPVRDGAKSEGQIGLELAAHARGHTHAKLFNAAETRQAMAAASADLGAMITDVKIAVARVEQEPDMQAVEV